VTRELGGEKEKEKEKEEREGPSAEVSDDPPRDSPSAFLFLLL